MMKKIAISLDTVYAKFVGTTCYYKLNESLLITEGIYFLVTKWNAYWLINMAFSHLARQNCSATFVVIKIRSTCLGHQLLLESEDGCNLSSQELFLLDTALLNVEIYGNKEANRWFFMLPSEY